MQAVILAGGKGARLKPYTVFVPKPLVPIGDYPILDVVIRQLKNAGIEELILSTGHLAELIEAYFGDGKKWGLSIRYVREEKPLNTAGALKLIDGLGQDFLVMNGDLLTNLDYGWLIDQHRQKGAAATVAVQTRESKVDFGVVETDSNGFLKHYLEKPVNKFLVSMGLYILSKPVIDLIAPGEALGMPDLLLRIQKQGGRVFCCPSDCFWLDIGRVDDYERAQEVFLEDPSVFLKDLSPRDGA